MKWLGGVVLALVLTAGARAADTGKPSDLSGVWWSQKRIPAIHPIDGSAIPFTAEGAAQYAKNKPLIKAIDSALPSLEDMRRCIPNGTPRVWGSGFPFQILQRPDEVILAYERDHMRRFVYIDQKPEDDPDPAYFGSSVGHWDGATLVIDTAAFKPTFLDDTGLPHGENLKITERLRKIGGGKTLEVLATIDDPQMYKKPWTARYTFTLRPNERIQDYMCGLGVVQSRFGTVGAVPKLRHHGS
ncbi:MAG TPA: hypothetical protein VL358_02825 [Caulobacteraceae bacterium]|jgi:hypothetical protein|nr:hypothetical protein [Caulobacteraceae bacterium]